MVIEWVLDASVSLRWVFEDQATAATDDLLSRVSVDDVHVPSLWRIEIANAITRRFREGALADHEALGLINDPMTLPLVVDEAPDWARVLRIAGYAQLLGLKVHDATYLELAIRLNAPLATLDRRPADAARRMGVAVLPAADA